VIGRIIDPSELLDRRPGLGEGVVIMVNAGVSWVGWMLFNADGGRVGEQAGEVLCTGC
jgi:hypothetical protein